MTSPWEGGVSTCAHGCAHVSAGSGGAVCFEQGPEKDSAARGICRGCSSLRPRRDRESEEEQGERGRVESVGGEPRKGWGSRRARSRARRRHATSKHVSRRTILCPRGA